MREKCPEDIHWCVSTIMPPDMPPTALGSVRAIVVVAEPAEAVYVRIPWRRVGKHPEEIRVRFFHGDEVMNVVPISVTREAGEFVFEAKHGGQYQVYWLPRTITGATWFWPIVRYDNADYAADPEWISRNGLKRADCLAQLPPAHIQQIEARSEFERFHPMELIATDAERAALRAQYPEKNYLVFPDDREHAIRMRGDIPFRWITSGVKESFAGSARPNEYFAFQLGLWALTRLENVGVETTDLRSDDGRVIRASSVTCVNTGGVDWRGRGFEKDVSVEADTVQPLWFGVDIPADAAGTYRGAMTIKPANAEPTSVTLTVEVAGELLPDRGDSDLWRCSRLRWLNSGIGLDDEPARNYPPVVVNGGTVALLGRQVVLGENGLPSSAVSFFSPGVERIDTIPTEILAEPVRFVAEIAGDPIEWDENGLRIVKAANGIAAFESSSRSDGFDMRVSASVESDGYLGYRVELVALKDISLSDARLEIVWRRQAATFLMGMGKEGGVRPSEWDYRWEAERTNHLVWIGAANAGLQCNLLLDDDAWLLHGMTEDALPRSWHNEGRGGVHIVENGAGDVLFQAFSGERTLRVGESTVFRFALLVTPFHTLETAAHWRARYYHTGGAESIADAVDAGATVINLHQGNDLNPYINYPFRNAAALSDYIRKAEAHAIRVKLYYTVRELSAFAEEIWILRSLGHEILATGGQFSLASAEEEDRPYRSTGAPWLCEHLIDDYVPAWQAPLSDGSMDCAVAVTGLSRWHNYYIEGLSWLARETGMAGLYLDGIGYDREIMKRVRKVLDRARPDALIDFHSGNNFDPHYGLNSPANQYLEHFPYLDSLWFGEGYDYVNKPLDYWLVEISGVPYGLLGEMLGDNTNPWRGMVFGMTGRFGWGADPRALWEFWDGFGMEGSRMIGWWSSECPVHTGNPNVPATVYLQPGKALIAIASWEPECTAIRLSIDWMSLGLDGATARAVAPDIPGLQEAREVDISAPFKVDPARGALLVVTGGR